MCTDEGTVVQEEQVEYKHKNARKKPVAYLFPLPRNAKCPSGRTGILGLKEKP